MARFILTMLALAVPPIILLIFSFAMLSAVLEKKNIKLDLFAFSFNFGKLKKKKANSEAQTFISVAEAPAEGEGIIVPPAAASLMPEKSTEALETIEFGRKHIQDMSCPLDFEEDFDGFDDFDKNSKAGKRTSGLMGGIKRRFTQIQIDAQAREIERKEKRLQEDFELYDDDELPEELPDDIGGKLKYWWRNHFGFRIGSCVLVVFLIFAVVFFGLQMRNQMLAGEQDSIAAVTDTDKTVENEEENLELDPELEKFRQALDDELSPIDVEADSMDEDPNLAEIVTTAQRNVGVTPTSYTGSNTTTQPSGSIGKISIPSINLKNAPVMGSVELSDLSKGTGHFENTPVFDGNVGIAGHNNTHFKYLVNVDIGDTIEYSVNGVTRTYQVTDMRAISDTDWGVFSDYGDNRLTLVTCEHLVPNSRIAVTAIQVGSDRGVSTGKVSTGKKNSSFWTDSGDYHDAGSGYTDYIGVFTGNN